MSVLQCKPPVGALHRSIVLGRVTKCRKGGDEKWKKYILPTQRSQSLNRTLHVGNSGLGLAQFYSH